MRRTPALETQAEPLARYLRRAPLLLKMAPEAARQEIARHRGALEADGGAPAWARSRLTQLGRDMLLAQIGQAEDRLAAAVADLHLWLERRIVSAEAQLFARRGPSLPLRLLPCEACVGIRFDQLANGATLADGTALYDVHISQTVRRGVSEADNRVQGLAPSPKSKRGPAPGETGYGASDRALFDELEQLMRGGKSRMAAALELARRKRIEGGGTPDSRAKRLARLHKSERPDWRAQAWETG